MNFAETASDISPYATYQLGDSGNTLLHSLMYQDRELMEGAPTAQTTVCTIVHVSYLKLKKILPLLGDNLKPKTKRNSTSHSRFISTYIRIINYASQDCQMYKIYVSSRSYY